MKTLDSNSLIKINDEYFVMNDDHEVEGNQHDIISLRDGKEWRKDLDKEDYVIAARLTDKKLSYIKDVVKTVSAYEIQLILIENAEKALEYAVRHDEPIQKQTMLKDDMVIAKDTVKKIEEFFKNEFGFEKVSEAYNYVTKLAKDSELKEKNQIER